ncbi:hypothetical protein [Myxococcus sp. Y35]|uniref:hypothetical protein n=1 Tax=Pseudomyxococcus flavus TaxID=3115648 RepID=UPI003CEF28E9
MISHVHSCTRLTVASLLASASTALAQSPFPGAPADRPTGTSWRIARSVASTFVNGGRFLLSAERLTGADTRLRVIARDAALT